MPTVWVEEEDDDDEEEENETEVSEWLIMVYPTGSSYFLYQGCKCSTVSIGFQEMLTETGQDSIANSYNGQKNWLICFCLCQSVVLQLSRESVMFLFVNGIWQSCASFFKCIYKPSNWIPWLNEICAVLWRCVALLGKIKLGTHCWNIHKWLKLM